MTRTEVTTVMNCCPAVYFICRRRNWRDPKSKTALSSHQASVLDHLDAHQPIHLHDLAGHVGVTASTMSLTVDRLERSGFVRRSRDQHDARRVNLLLTETGVQAKQQQKVLDPSLIELMLKRLTKDQRQAALSGLRTLARAAREMAAARVGGH